MSHIVTYQLHSLSVYGNHFLKIQHTAGHVMRPAVHQSNWLQASINETA